MRTPTQARSEAWRSGYREAALQLEIQATRSMDAELDLDDALRGIEALWRGDTTQVLTCFESLVVCPEMPHVQAICLSGWIWAHTRTDRLEKVLTETPLSGVTTWSSEFSRLETLERLVMWALQEEENASEMLAACLAILCVHEGQSLLATLQLLCRPGYLSDDLNAVLMAGLSMLTVEMPHTSWADAVTELLGYDALVSRIEPLLATCDQPVGAQAADARPRKRRPSRRLTSQTERKAHRARLHHLVERLTVFSQHEDQSRLPKTIAQWLLRYPNLSQNASEVVGMLLGLLREHPGAGPQRQMILDRVDLSKRQRQLLQEAQLKSDDMSVLSAPDWEPLRYETLDRLLARLRDGQPYRATSQNRAAMVGYTLGVTLARVGLVNRASDVLQACLRQAPEQLLAHFMLGQILRLQHRTTTAWNHTIRAWELLQAQSPEPTLLHLQVINQILVLLGIRKQGDTFFSWIETFNRIVVELKTAVLSPDQERRLHHEEGECALSHMLNLLTFAPLGQSEEALAEQQLTLLAKAVEKGNALTRHNALHYRADLLSRWQQLDEAVLTYTHIVEQWPDDHQARFRHALLTASQLAAESDGDGAELALAEALALAFAAGPRHDRPSPLTFKATLIWLRHTSARDTRYPDVVDVLTAYGRIAFQCAAFDMAIEILAPLYEITGEPRQAYYLAKAYHVRGQQAVSETAALADCERAIILAQHALESELHRTYADVLLAELEADRARLVAVQMSHLPRSNHPLDDIEDMTELQVISSDISTLEVQASQGDQGVCASVQRPGLRRDLWSRFKRIGLFKLLWKTRM